MKNLHNRIKSLSIVKHILLTVVAFAALQGANFILNQSYARSKFPVPYMEGQTAFNGDLIKSYYQTMIDADTLGVYWQTQFIDYLFIACMFSFGLIMPLLVRRLYKEGSVAYRLSTLTAFLIPIGAMFDAVENLVSFVMLAQPLTFPNWVALVYSSLATLKFGSIGIGYLCLFASMGVFVVGWLIGKVVKGNRPLRKLQQIS